MLKTLLKVPYYQQVLARKLSEEFQVPVKFARRKGKILGDAAALYRFSDSTVYLANNLNDNEFHFLVFHELRHAIQDKQGLYLFRPQKVTNSADAVRYVIDSFRAEMDADSFGISECMYRGLDADVQGFYARYKAKDILAMLQKKIDDMAMIGFEVKYNKAMFQVLKILGFHHAKA